MKPFALVAVAASQDVKQAASQLAKSAEGKRIAGALVFASPGVDRAGLAREVSVALPGAAVATFEALAAGASGRPAAAAALLLGGEGVKVAFEAAPEASSVADLTRSALDGAGLKPFKARFAMVQGTLEDATAVREVLGSNAWILGAEGPRSIAVVSWPAKLGAHLSAETDRRAAQAALTAAAAHSGLRAPVASLVLSTAGLAEVSGLVASFGSLIGPAGTRVPSSAGQGVCALVLSDEEDLTEA